MKKSIVYVGLMLLGSLVFSQPCNKLNIQDVNQIDATCQEIAMTMTYDLTSRPYIYVANKEAGLTIYKLGSTKDPLRVGQIPIDSLDNLEVMGVSQYGTKLYLALGNFFSAKENPGMAIVDIADPENASLVGFWKYPTATEGASLVKVAGNYAYLTAFSHGLFILNISDPNEITLESEYVPTLNYPDANPDASKINARGMVLDDNIVYLCYDAGGIRIINVSDKKNPIETGRYSNPVMDKKPRAYNNAVLRDSLLYVGVDYCGVEILNVKDTSNLKLVSWWNPWDCQTSPLNWFSSNGHVNEVVLDSQENKLFVSTGKSDLHVVDVSDPTKPDSCSMYGGIDNNIGTWGVNRYKNKLCLSYICTFVPFSSNYSGVKLLEYDRLSSSGTPLKTRIKVQPNPAGGHVEIYGLVVDNQRYRILSMTGKVVQYGVIRHNNRIDLSRLNNGVYTLDVESYQPTKVLISKP